MDPPGTSLSLRPRPRHTTSTRQFRSKEVSNSTSPPTVGKPKQWLARLVAAMPTPLRLEHRPFDLVGLAAEFLDCVPNLFICQVRFVNLNRCHWSCSLALCIRRTFREPTIAPAMNPITSPKTLFMA